MGGIRVERQHFFSVRDALRVDDDLSGGNLLGKVPPQGFNILWGRLDGHYELRAGIERRAYIDPHVRPAVNDRIPGPNTAVRTAIDPCFLLRQQGGQGDFSSRTLAASSP